MGGRLKEILACLWARIEASSRFLLTQLNFIGTALLTYIIANPSAPSDLFSIFPTTTQPYLKLAVPVAWFFLVQYAKKRAMRVAANGAAPAA